MPREKTEVPREKGSGSRGYMPSGSRVRMDTRPRGGGGAHHAPALRGAAGSSLELVSSPFIFRKDWRRQQRLHVFGSGGF